MLYWQSKTPRGPPPPYAATNYAHAPYAPDPYGIQPPPPNPPWHQYPNPVGAHNYYPPAASPWPAYPAQPTPAPAPTTFSHVVAEYPYVVTARRQMALLTPDGTAPLLTALYPSTSTWTATTPRLSVRRGGPDGPEVGCACFHTWTGGGKVDAEAGGRRYRFRKRFDSRTGLAAAAAGTLVWSVCDGALVLTEGDKDGPMVARFVGRDGAGLAGATVRLEGRLEIRRPGLTAEQFDEVFVTLVAEMERKRRLNEDWDLLLQLLGGS